MRRVRTCKLIRKKYQRPERQTFPVPTVNFGNMKSHLKANKSLRQDRKMTEH